MNKPFMMSDLNVRWWWAQRMLALANRLGGDDAEHMALAALDRYFDAVDQAVVQFHVTYR